MCNLIHKEEIDRKLAFTFKMFCAHCFLKTFIFNRWGFSKTQKDMLNYKLNNKAKEILPIFCTLLYMG